METTKKRPVHEVKLGLIRAAVWANETTKGTMHSVTISRLYRVGKDWKDSSSFGRDDLLGAAKVLDLAHTYLLTEARKSPEPVEESDEPNV